MFRRIARTAKASTSGPAMVVRRASRNAVKRGRHNSVSTVKVGAGAAWRLGKSPIHRARRRRLYETVSGQGGRCELPRLQLPARIRHAVAVQVTAAPVPDEARVVAARRRQVTAPFGELSQEVQAADEFD